MQVSVADEVIEITIRKNLDFNTAQNLLLCCKVHANLHAAASAKIRLANVAKPNSCGIAAIALITDWMPGGLKITLNHCSQEVHQWIAYSQDKDHLCAPPTSSCSFLCNSCFDNNDYPASALDAGNTGLHRPSLAEC